MAKIFISAYGMVQVRREIQSLSDADLSLVKDVIEKEMQKRVDDRLIERIMDLVSKKIVAATKEIKK